MDSGRLFRELLAGNQHTGDPGMLDHLGLSVEKFALAIGVTRTSVYFYLSGKTLPSSNTLHKMAEVLGMPPKDLFDLLPTREPGAPLRGRGTVQRNGQSPSQTRLEETMKYTKRKNCAGFSDAADEVRAVLISQDPPLGNKAAADMIGVNYETMRAVVSDNRIPSIGVVFGLAHSLNLSEGWVKKLLDLRQKDLVQKKVDKAIASSGASDLESLVTIMSSLPKRQLEELKATAIKLAKETRGIE